MGRHGRQAAAGPGRAPRLTAAFDPRENSLNALRLLLACAVLASHSWQFARDESDPVGRLADGPDLGDMSVDGFFLISGFLITRSQLRASSTGRYLWHRFLRIVPGFWVCLLATAFVLAPVLWWLERDTLAGYPWLGADSALTYVAVNGAVCMNQFNIGDLQGGAALDGSLHTLFFEMLCYLLIAALGALGVLRRRRWLVLVAAAAFTVVAAVEAIVPGDVLATTYTVRWTGVFLVGSTMFLYGEHIPLTRPLTAAAVLLVAVAVAVPSAYLALAPAAFGYLLLHAGTSPRLARVAVRRDLSYGIYIYAWPLQLICSKRGQTPGDSPAIWSPRSRPRPSRRC